MFSYSFKPGFLGVRDEDKRSQVKDADKLHSAKNGMCLKTAASAHPPPPPTPQLPIFATLNISFY
jgi:hypothetical protein